MGNRRGAVKRGMRIMKTSNLFCSALFILAIALRAGGAVDLAFNPNANYDVICMASQPDGKVLVGGVFSTLNGQPHNCIGRLNADGSLDGPFRTDADNLVYSLVVQGDGKILVGGLFTTLGGKPRSRIARLNPDGSVDESFNPGANNMAWILRPLPDGKLLVGGWFTFLDGHPCSNLARLNADGSFDPGFHCTFGYPIISLGVQADGKIVVAGDRPPSEASRGFVQRLNADGTLDDSFWVDADLTVYALAIQLDGKILVSGDFTTLAGQSRSRIGRLNPDGTLDNEFNPGANTWASSIIPLADGNTLLAGFFTSVAGQPRAGLAVLNLDGSLGSAYDQGSNPPGDQYFWTGSGQGDGKILLGGGFSNVCGQPRSRIARLLSRGGSQLLTASPDGTTVTWKRSGPVVEVEDATFEESVDGVNYSLLGRPTRFSGGWQLTGLSLPQDQDLVLRARGTTIGGYRNAARGLLESVTVIARNPPPLIRAQPLTANGDRTFVFANSAAHGFTVLGTTNISLAPEMWTTLAAPAALGGGVYQFTDSVTGNAPQRFYRLRWP